jgi:hypothetical protein
LHIWSSGESVLLGKRVKKKKMKKKKIKRKEKEEE